MSQWAQEDCLCWPRGLTPCLSPSCDHVSHQHARTHIKPHIIFYIYIIAVCTCSVCSASKRGRDTEGERESVCAKWIPCTYTGWERAEGGGARFQPLSSLKDDSSCVIKLAASLCHYGGLKGVRGLIFKRFPASAGSRPRCIAALWLRRARRREPVWHTEPSAQSGTSVWCSSQSAACSRG